MKHKTKFEDMNATQRSLHNLCCILEDDASTYEQSISKAIDEITELKQQRDELQVRCDNYHDVLYEIIDAASELISIVKIHSNETQNNFAWAELQNLDGAIANKEKVL